MKNNWSEISGIANYDKFLRGDKPVFRKKVITDSKGEPINHTEFRIQIGDLSFDKPKGIIKDEGEKEKVKDAKSKYQSTMRSFMGEHWRKISRVLGIYNYTEDIELVKQVNALRAKLGS